MGAQAIPAAIVVLLMFTVPIQAGQGAAVAYALITNLLLSAVFYTFIATPFSAIMVVRTRSLAERGSMGLIRAVGNYGAGMIISIFTVPVTSMLGGTPERLDQIRRGTGPGGAAVVRHLLEQQSQGQVRLRL